MGRIDWNLADGGDKEDVQVISSAIGGAPDRLLLSIGRLVCAWGLFEGSLEDRIDGLRMAAGEIRAVGNRSRPSMARRFAELRAVVAMRDRRNVDALTEIAGIESEIQRIDSIRMMVTEGFQASDGDGLLCRDGKNRTVRFALEGLDKETDMLGTLRVRLATI